MVLNGNPASAASTDPYSTLTNSMNLYIFIVTALFAAILFFGYRRISDIEKDVEEKLKNALEKYIEKIVNQIADEIIEARVQQAMADYLKQKKQEDK